MARKKQQTETAETSALELPEYRDGGVRVRTPQDNLASRSNIVPDGAGTVGQFLTDPEVSEIP